jgi:hypothetical protein
MDYIVGVIIDWCGCENELVKKETPDATSRVVIATRLFFWKFF